MADTPTGETVTPEAPSNNATPTATPVVNAVDPAEFERLKKEAEQATLRANQLANQLKAKEEAEAASKAKQLEENQQFKELWEKSEAEKQALLDKQAEEQRKAELANQTSTVLSSYSPTVQELARTAGLTLSDDSDEAQAELKAKLDAFAAKVPSARVEPNNPAPSAPGTPDRESALNVMRMNNVPNSAKQAATKKAIGSLESMKVLRANAGIPEPTQQ